MKKLTDAIDILKSEEFSTKIFIYMSTKTEGEGYDGYEDNFTYTNLNPVAIKGYVRQVSPEALIYKQYGLHEMGAVEIICESKYENYFKLSTKIVIDGVDYQVFKEAVGSKALIQTRPYKLLRIILSRNG